MNCISYALFGYDTGRQDGCFDYLSYMRSLAINIRLARLLYPNWEVVIHLDYASHAAHKDYWDKLSAISGIRVIALPKEPLTKAMLWRMKPIFETSDDGHPRYEYTICRDTDSPLTFRDRQAVQYWVDKKTKIAHAITDSISHTVPMMGGMIGFSKDFMGRTGWNSWERMMEDARGHDFTRKGADQDFLNQRVYPKVSQHGYDSIVQHYFNGMPNTYLSGYHTCRCEPEQGHAENCPNNYKIDLSDDMKESNTIGGHIGSAGWWERPTFDFLSKYKTQFTDIQECEALCPDVFYWNKQGTI